MQTQVKVKVQRILGGDKKPLLAAHSSQSLKSDSSQASMAPDTSARCDTLPANCNNLLTVLLLHTQAVLTVIRLLGAVFLRGELALFIGEGPAPSPGWGTDSELCKHLVNSVGTGSRNMSGQNKRGLWRGRDSVVTGR